MNTDDPDAQQRRDELISGINLIDKIMSDRSALENNELHASRQALLNGDAPPPSKPRLRVIEGGKGKP